MTAIEIQNWIAIYGATAVCCALATILAIISVGTDVFRERTWREVHDVKSAILFAPKLWWRWQKRYLLSTPVTLAIVAAFALSLDWTR